MSPKISVIMPTYNHAKYISSAVDSVLNQTFENWELVIIDNYSDDNTQEVVENYSDKRIKYIKFHNHGIIAASRNEGIKKAQGEYVAFLDSDDQWKLNKLEEVDKAISKMKLEDDSYVGVSHTADLYVDEKFVRSDKFEKPKDRTLYDQLLFHCNILPNSGTVISREEVLKVGLLNTNNDHFGVEDFDLWLNILEQDKKIYLLNSPLSIYNMRTGVSFSDTRSIALLENARGVIFNHLDRNPKFKENKKIKNIQSARIDFYIAREYHQKKEFKKSLEYYSNSIKFDLFNVKKYIYLILARFCIQR